MGIISPVYLFADSELLFWTAKSVLFLKTLLRFVSEPQPSASYIGASNGDRPEFYDIFRAAMENIGVTETRMIREAFERSDREFLSRSKIVLLAGGNAANGWRVIKESGLADAVLRKHADGALIIGVSAGAMQLGLGMLSVDEEDPTAVWIETLRIVPFVVDVREEGSNWRSLRSAVRLPHACGQPGIGIPAGGGIVYYPDHSIGAVRRPATEFRLEGDAIAANVMRPETGAEWFREH
jgi:hypothetical protein